MDTYYKPFCENSPLNYGDRAELEQYKQHIRL